MCYSQFNFVKPAYPIDVLQIHSGHSLTDPLFSNWPGQYVNLVGHVNDLGGWEIFNVMVGKSTGPGSSINYRWQNSTGPPDARLNIVDWELLSITERIPLFYDGGGTEQWYIDAIDAQREDLSIFVNNAWNNGNGGNGAPSLLWTTWVRIDGTDGDFRSMLDSQGTEWENMQAYANANRPTGAEPVFIIPGHKMMARIYDDIQAGLVPGITNISQLFDDNVHVNELGAYAVAMLHYACIFNESPVGLPHDLQFGTVATFPSASLATYFQNIVVDIVTSYPETGISSLNSALAIELINFNVEPIASKTIKISWETASEFENESFAIERSEEGVNWDLLMEIEGAGTSTSIKSYEHYDEAPLEGASYYRLKQTDFDGRSSYSKVRKINIDNINSRNIKTYPNPSRQFVTIKGSGENLGFIKIYDASGREVTGMATTSIIDDSEFQIDISSLITGSYLIKTAVGTSVVHKL
jgi:hypothetical protein